MKRSSGPRPRTARTFASTRSGPGSLATPSRPRSMERHIRSLSTRCNGSGWNERKRRSAGDAVHQPDGVATGLWGSNMIKEMLKLRGSDLESWYDSMDRDRTQSAALFAWTLREELFALKLEVDEPDGWKHRGTLPGGGPFIAEDRVVVLDVSQATGDQLRIRIRPPVGFWALNSFAAARFAARRYGEWRAERASR